MIRGPFRFLTGSVLDSRVSQYGQRGLVKSVQRGTINLTSVTSNTATITAVTLANCLVSYLGTTFAVATNNAAVSKARVELTNTTTVTAYQNTANANATDVSFEVLEFYPGVIRQLQRGTLVMSGGLTATVSPALNDTTKALLTTLGYTTTATDQDVFNQPKIVLTNTTTITASAAGNTTATIGYQVAEFY